MYVCTHVLDRVEMFAFVAATAAAAAESVGFVQVRIPSNTHTACIFYFSKNSGNKTIFNTLLLVFLSFGKLTARIVGIG